MNKFIFICVFVISAVCYVTEARPDGAPVSACETMMPQHGVTAQPGPAPYSISMEGDTFMVGEMKRGE